MSNITAARKAATQRILEGDGQTTREERKAAFANERTPEAARALLDKVTQRAAQIGDDDIKAAKAAGLTEDQIFELVVAASRGVSTRQYEGALAALAQATETK